MSARVAARFYVYTIKKVAAGYTAVELMPSTKGEGNKEWAHYTPSGKIEMNISPDSGAAAFFEERLGEDVAITFEDVVG